jgi:hypothetical protein
MVAMVTTHLFGMTGYAKMSPAGHLRLAGLGQGRDYLLGIWLSAI